LFKFKSEIILYNQTEASAKFNEAGRPDLAKLEQEEVVLLSKFLPPQLSTIEIDAQLIAIMGALPKDLDPKKLIGAIFKEFYSKVDKSSVDANLVKERAQNLVKSLTPLSS
jgi:uncharacterized protein